MSQTQFDAFVLLAYNIGADGFKGSSIVTKFNEGKNSEAAAVFLEWNKITVGGVKVESKGLTNRRTEEKLLFESGTYSQ